MPITVTSPYKKAAAWLSWIAYLGDDANPKQQHKCISDALQQKITADANGPYKLVWGPASKDGFLAYVAKSTVDGNYAVGCRGTLSYTDPLGFLTNIVADGEFFIAELWHYPKYSTKGTSGYYTAGMEFAFDSVKSAPDPTTGVKMQRFLQGQGNPIDILVAGHSLGGALANLIAVYLADQLPANVASFTFAAPTITNDTWGSDIFNKYIKTSYQCVNRFDVVPMAYWIDSMPEIELTYLWPNEELLYYEDGVVAAGVALAIAWLRFEQLYSGNKYNYTPVAGRHTFDGTIGAKPPQNWPAEAYRQHSLVGSYFPAVGLSAPKENGECEKNQMGRDRPEGLPEVGPEGIIVKNTKGKKLKIAKVSE